MAYYKESEHDDPVTWDEIVWDQLFTEHDEVICYDKNHFGCF